MLRKPDYLASDLLRTYLNEFKQVLNEEKRIFACYAEFKAHLYRNSEHRDVDYKRFADAVGCRKILTAIFERGQKDGSIKTQNEPEANAGYLANSIMYYFSNAVLLYDTQPDLMAQYVDSFIEDTWNQYCGDWLFFAP
jgi:hypothetical protein